MVFYLKILKFLIILINQIKITSLNQNKQSKISHLMVNKSKINPILQSILQLAFLITLIIPATECQSPCVQYLKQLQAQSIVDPLSFLHRMTPYLVLSGKSIDDLGFPGSCQKDQNKYTYYTVQVTIDANTTIATEYTGYLGFCFTSMCSVDQLNQFADFIIDFIFEEYRGGVNGEFILPPLQLQFSPSALVFCLLFLAIIIIAMLQPILRWLQLCRKPADSQYQITSLYIDLQNPNNQLQQDRLTTQSSLLQRISLRYKWKELWKEETSYNVYSFSMYRVITVPMLLFGQIFWLTNYGAYNYYAFYEEIYNQFYVKVAIFAYYVPDGFFFISAFLFTRKILQFGQGEYVNLFKAFAWKLARLYPLYIVVLIIYWGVSPALHCGPIWYIYQQQVQVCNSVWWRVLLLIDNWWASGCYPALWFVQVQIQFALFVTLFFFTFLIYSRKIGLWLLAIYNVIAFVILFVFDAEMLVSVLVAIDPYTQLYFKSFYSHIWFYLVGVVFAIIAEKESVRIGMQNLILDKTVPYIILRVVSAGVLFLILFRPWVWSGQVNLSLQLTVCRIGYILCLIIFFLQGMFVKQSHTTVLHKYAYYMYPVILVSYMIAMSSFWSSGSFMYVSGYDILNEMVPNFIISYTVGIFLGILFDWRNIVNYSNSDSNSEGK